MFPDRIDKYVISLLGDRWDVEFFKYEDSGPDSVEVALAIEMTPEALRKFCEENCLVPIEEAYFCK